MERRVIYEQAAIAWIRAQRPSLLQVIAVLEWAERRRSLGPPEDAIPDPDPERPEDMVTSIPLAHVDVRFGYPEGDKESVLWVRAFTSY